jgi:hypothetical protein
MTADRYKFDKSIATANHRFMLNDITKYLFTSIRLLVYQDQLNNSKYQKYIMSWQVVTLLFTATNTLPVIG